VKRLPPIVLAVHKKGGVSRVYWTGFGLFSWTYKAWGNPSVNPFVHQWAFGPFTAVFSRSTGSRDDPKRKPFLSLALPGSNRL